MTLALLFALVSAAAPSLAQPDFDVANVKPDIARFCQEHLSTEISARGVRVVTAREIQSMLGMERQRQMLGCADDSASCMAELANALGTDGILLGSLAKLGSKYQLNIKVLSSKDARLITTYRAAIDREDDLVAGLTKAAEALVPEILAKLRAAEKAPVVETKPPVVELPTEKQPVAQTVVEKPPEAVAVAEEPVVPRVRRWPIIPSAVAGGALVVGGVLHLFAYDAANRLTNNRQRIRDGEAVKARGEALQTGAFIGYGVAATALAASAVLFFRGEPIPVALSVSSSGGAVVLSGAFQ